MATAAVTDQESVEKSDIPLGHKVVYTLFMRPLMGRLPLHIVRQYHTGCPILPTSWRLQILFSRNGNAGPVSLRVRVTRMDEINRPVKLFIWMRCFIHSRTIFQPSSCTKENVMPHQDVDGSVNEVIQPEDAAFLLSQKGLFKFFIQVEFCHPKSSEENVGQKDEISKKGSSKM